jgi:hypothetical protein
MCVEGTLKRSVDPNYYLIFVNENKKLMHRPACAFC